MYYFVRVLSFIKPYWAYAVLNAFFNLLAIAFSLVSITMIIPFLGVLFNTQKKVYSAQELSLSISSIKENVLLFITKIIDSYGNAEALAFICVVVISAFFFRNLFRYLALFFMSPLRAGVVKDIRACLYEKVCFLPLGYFSNRKKGNLISRISNDVQEIEWTIMTSLELIVKEPITIIIYLTTLFIWSPSLTFLVFILLPLSGFIIGGVAKSLKKSSLAGQKQIANIVSVLEETISGIKILKAFNAIGYAKKKFNASLREHEKIQIKILRKKDLSSPVSELLSVFFLVIIMWYGGKIVLGGSGFSAEVFIGYVALFSQIIPPSKSLTTALYNIQKGNASAQRIYEILDEPVLTKNDTAQHSINDFKNEICFKNISFSYEEKRVLKNVNLTIKRGEKIAFVGPSGAGKTTLINILLRLYKPTTGDVFIDKIPINNYSLSDFISLISIVSQDVFLFNDTIKNNIALGAARYNNSLIKKVAKISNSHEFIMDMPDGYNSFVGDMGVKLSGGQKQRISLARALLKNPQILVLDEATSSLDAASEKSVQDAISLVMKKRTSIVVAHKIAAIKNVDKIFVLDKGEIVEEGTHENLMKNNRLYKKLYQIQSLQL